MLHKPLGIPVAAPANIVVLLIVVRAVEGPCAGSSIIARKNMARTVGKKIWCKVLEARGSGKAERSVEDPAIGFLFVGNN